MQGVKSYYSPVRNEKIFTDLLIKVRQQQEIVCRKCKNRARYRNDVKKDFECKKYRYLTSLIKETLMGKNILPWSKCLPGIGDMSTTKEKISTHKLQKVLEPNRNEPYLSKINKKYCLTKT